MKEILMMPTAVISAELRKEFVNSTQKQTETGIIYFVKNDI